MAPGQALTYITALRKELQDAGITVDKKNIIINSGRVRAGYMVGDILFDKADPNKPRAVVHIIGERPGTGQNAFSVYIAAPKAKVWAEKKVDHNIVKVVCGISKQATKPEDAAKQTVKLLKEYDGNLNSFHPETPDEKLTVFNSETRIFSSWQGNQEVARRRTSVRRTSKLAD